ncbi:GspE/PulE family protein [Ensifer soli]|uniref:GspE/PulE family protein n=1 Tax=Ciceribacter sp. sgz301302 TaxID=3342379 RepID=UPI0035B85441
MDSRFNLATAAALLRFQAKKGMFNMPSPAPSPAVSEGFPAFLAARIGVAVPVEAASSAQELWRNGVASAADIADCFAQYCDLPRASFDEVAARPALLTDLSRRYLRECNVFPFSGEDAVCVAIADPTRDDAIKALKLALGCRPNLVVVSFEDIELLFERTAQQDEGVTGVSADETVDNEALDDTLQSMQDLARGAPIVRLIDEILERAVSTGATDVHLETERDQLRVRFRVDGQLRRDQRLPLAMAPAVISRIKILAGLDIADRRLPQDGRANLRIGSAEADLRVAVMPTMYGETAVLRILLRDSRLLDLGRIGMNEKDQESLAGLLAEPHGIIVVTGPTGSGKTTTLATAISMLNDPKRKIVTVEDPIEYQIAGIHQTQIKPSIGLTFASALRSFLRHDPDIIMVGEMRDRETAGIGVQAALTGHLVLTTLHTNSASDAVVRLIDMGVEPYLLGSSLRGIIGQRLVRRLCDRCKIADEAAAGSARQLAERRSLRFPQESAYHRATGCETCGHTGYRGRIGVFEVLRADEEIRALVRENPAPTLLSERARQDGMTLMLEDGLAKSAAGLTTVEEVLRATG